MADIKLTVDFGDVVKAEAAANNLEKGFASIARAAKRGVSSHASLSAVFDRLTKAGITLDQVFASMQRDMDMNAKTAARLETSYMKLNLANKSARESAAAFSRELTRQEGAVENLKTKYIPLYAESKRYERALEEIEEATRQGILTDQQAAAAKENLARGMIVAGNAAGQQRAKMSQMGVVTQQAGYQVGDFLVQIQSGANPMMAFGQQATQLVGVLPLMSSALGVSAAKLIGISAVLGIAIPLITAVAGFFWAASKAAKAAAKEVDNQTESLKRTNDELSAFLALKDRIMSGRSDNVLVLTKQFNDLTEKIKAAEAIAKTMAVDGPQANARAAIESSIIKFKNEQLDLAKSIAVEGERQQFNAEAELQALEDKSILLLAEAQGYKDTNFYLELQAKQQKAAFALATKRRNINDSLKTQLIAQYNAMVDFQLAVDKTNDKAEILSNVFKAMSMDNILAQMDILNTKLGTAIFNGGKFMSVIGSRIAAGAKSLVTSAKAFKELRNMPLAGQGALYGAGQQASRKLIAEGYKLPEEPKGRSSSGGGSGSVEKDPLAELVKRIELDTKLLGVSESRAEVMRKLGEDADKYDRDEVDAVVQRLDLYKLEKEALELIKTNQQSIADTLKNSMSDAFMSMVEGTKSFKDAMKDMARAVIKQLFDVLVVQKLVGDFNSKTGKGSGLVGSIMGIFASANGNVFSNGSHVQAFANGGVVGGPTMFPMNGGKTGLMGEAGPEAIMPLKRGANGKLGVEASGGGAATVSQNFYFTANGDESVKRIIQQEAPRIANLTQKQIMDQRRRGGNMKATFG